MMYGRRGYLRIDLTKPREHPDSWVSTEIPEEAREAVLEGEGLVGGRPVLYYRDLMGREWATLKAGQSWRGYTLVELMLTVAAALLLMLLLTGLYRLILGGVLW